MTEVMHRQRTGVLAAEQATRPRHPPRTLKKTSAAAGHFALHFAEMWIAMTVGMVIFVPVRLGLVAHGYAALVDSASIDYEALDGSSWACPWLRACACAATVGAR